MKYNRGKCDPTGWWVSEKLDGVRCVASYSPERKCVELFTRTGKRINAPAEFTAAFPQDVTLDGELYGNRTNFDEVSGITRKKTPIETEWRGIKYMVFDVVDTDMRFEERQAVLAAVLPPRHPTCSIVAQTRCTGADHLAKMFDRVVDQLNGEGLMLREPESRYAFKRSSTLLKMKAFRDIEATVIGHIAGKGRNLGRLGALVCVLENGKRFKCGSGFSDSLRENPPGIDSVITVKFFEMTKNGVPRFPAFLRIHTPSNLGGSINYTRQVPI